MKPNTNTDWRKVILEHMYEENFDGATTQLVALIDQYVQAQRQADIEAISYHLGVTQKEIEKILESKVYE